MLPQEAEQLATMCGGVITTECERLALTIKRKMLLTGATFALSRETLAIIATLAGSMEQVTEPVDVTPVEESIPDATPVDEAALSDAQDYSGNGNGNGNGHGYDHYDGKAKWETEFKSTPRTPIAKLEKGRPIGYLDDGVFRSGRFVRVNPKDKRKAIIMSTKKKAPYSIPTSEIIITDLSPPSREPRAVQI
jgi:hypothetical protein